MTLYALIDSLPQTAVVGSAEREVSGLADDSRAVGEGFVFVAVRGDEVDGHEYINKALDAGAVAVVAETPPPGDLRPGVTWVMVRSTRDALALLADAWCGMPSLDLRVVGVTGTNGKTTTAFLLHAIMQRVLQRVGLLGTIHFHDGNKHRPATHTTPGVLELQTLLGEMRDNGCQGVAMEVSSHAIDQGRVASVAFDTAVFTNLTQDHLDYHGTMERYFESKRGLFEQMAFRPRGKTPTAVINLDDAHGQLLARQLKDRLRVITYGFGVDCDFRAGNVKQTKRGMEYPLSANGKTYLVRLPLIGRFNVYNSLAALAAAAAVRIPLREAVAALADVPQVPGRLEFVGSVDGVSVYVDYAHTPDALENVCATIRELSPRRLVTVFGCGGDRDRAKRPLMAKAASSLSDWCIVTSDNPRSEDPEAIIRDAQRGMVGKAHEAVVDRAEAIRHAVVDGWKGDVVIIAGKGHEDYQQFADRRISFDDRKVARAALAERQNLNMQTEE
jgi:UDP-N-acetylmuramoyl-L-alanyl-D-glutamate--2,6-diaminopimelate ligase